MINSVRIHEFGGPQVLSLEQIAVQSPGAGEVWLDQAAIGVNPLDLSQRSGAVRVALPSALGLEGAGRVSAIGAGVTEVAVSDRVASATGPLGAYASGRLYPANRLVRIADELGFAEAAAVMFKGITAQYLLKTTYPLNRQPRGPGTWALRNSRKLLHTVDR
ncbi:2-haloacrylate reductase [Pseudomonas fluorescens]|uniref:2-haloacrylate reductase n=1 Tax=Pseudomonas fluorescens TaxID=294 RepID=A0A5E7T669_PSEFL|nr:2-haloacrylate reductase [Pseudomonas fluorescens]